jgi:hypothetical protein
VSRRAIGGVAAFTRERFPSDRDEIVPGSPSWRHTLGIRSKYNLDEEDTALGIVTTLMALLADHVMGIVATTRRNYLTEFNTYLDEQQLTERPKPRSTPA